MKRSLVLDYGSSDDDEPARKKALPSLSKSLTLPTPIDDPSKHQGRQRTRPHVEGQFAAHVYVSLQLNSETRTLLEAIIHDAQTSVPEIHSLLNFSDNQNDKNLPEQNHKELGGLAVASSSSSTLHVSLSRPIYLRAHQREDLRRTVRLMANQFAPFVASFTTIELFRNDEKTREFLSIEIGAGHHEFKQLADALTPQLRLFYQQPYYDAPRFHASIAWALLRTTSSGSPSETREEDDNEIQDTHNEPVLQLIEANEGKDTPLPSVTEIPKTTLATIQSAYSKDLRRLGRFKIRNICLKIGKEIKEWQLTGGQ